MILVNGLPADCVSAQDRGLAYGDGVFRTTRLQRGRILHWERQYERLAQDCAALDMVCPARQSFEQDIDAVLARHDTGVVKLTVTRGEGRRGYAPHGVTTPTRLLHYAALPVYPDDWLHRGVAVRLCRLRLARQPRLAGIKHLNRLEQVLARAEWQDEEIFEGLLCDQRGWLISGTMTNLFVRRGNRLLTPRLSHCGVAGLTRDLVTESASALGLTVQEDTLTVEFLKKVDEVLLCNSLIGVWPVRCLDDKVWPVSGLAAALREKLLN